MDPHVHGNEKGGVGGAFTFACTAWWRVIYLLCLVVSRLKGVLVIWPDSRRERKRRVGYPYRSCRTSAPLFSGSGAEIAPDGHIQWRRAHWCLWAICYETKAASWRRSIDDDNPSDNEGSSQFLTGRLHGLNLKIDDWCDITELEQEKWGPALRNRLEGEAPVYKRLLDRDELRQANGRGVEHFKRTLRPHFVKGAQTVFLYRFMKFMKNNRGNGDFMKWMTRFQIDGRRLAEYGWISCQI